MASTTPTSSGKLQLPAIIGLVFGGASLLIFGTVFLCLQFHKRRHQEEVTWPPNSESFSTSVGRVHPTSSANRYTPISKQKRPGTAQSAFSVLSQGISNGHGTVVNRPSTMESVIVQVETVQTTDPRLPSPSQPRLVPPTEEHRSRARRQRPPPIVVEPLHDPHHPPEVIAVQPRNRESLQSASLGLEQSRSINRTPSPLDLNTATAHLSPPTSSVPSRSPNRTPSTAASSGNPFTDRPRPARSPYRSATVEAYTPSPVPLITRESRERHRTRVSDRAATGEPSLTQREMQVLATMVANRLATRSSPPNGLSEEVRTPPPAYS